MQPNNVLRSRLGCVLILSALFAVPAFLGGCGPSDNFSPQPPPPPLTTGGTFQTTYQEFDAIFDPAPPNAPPFPSVPFRPLLQRQSNCSLTRFAVGATGTLLSTYPNYQDYLHAVSGLTTTPDRFSNGCKDPTIGIMSESALSLGPITNGNLAVGTVSSDGIQVFVVNGSTFALLSMIDYPSIPSPPNPDSLTPQAVTAADLNGDGNLDVVVVNSGSGNPVGTVAIFLGKGDGTLNPPTVISLPIVALAVTVDDVNNDGKLDLVVLGAQPSSANGAVVTLLGNGDGTFQAPIVGPALASFSSGTAGAVVADFNNDGNKDIATTRGQILLGNGDGTFKLVAQPAFPSPNGLVNGLAAGDLNNDGKIDLAISNPQANSIDIYLGNGDGTFAFKDSYATMNGAQIVTITDLDGDGNLDIFVGAAQGGLFGQDATTQGIFQSLLGRGDGTFTAPVDYSSNGTFGVNAATFGSLFDVADFNADGKPDIIRLDANSSGPVLSILLGQGDGSFQPGPQTAITLPGQPGQFEGLAAADVNGDGMPDVVFASSDTGSGTGNIGVLLGKGGGAFQTQVNYPVTGVITSVVVADVNGDGFPDVIAATGFYPDFFGGGATTQLFLLLNNGDGTFKAPTLIDSKPYLFQVAAKDVNGDGHTDLVVTAGGNILDKMPGAIYLYLGNGDGTFKPATTLNISGASFPAAVAIADVNGDGKLDVVTIDYQTGNLLVLLGNGNGTFQNPIVTHTSNTFVFDIGIANLDSRGIPDIVLPGLVAVVLDGNGDGTFEPPVPLYAAPESNFVRLVDVNGDGRPDVLIDSGFAGLHVLLSNAGSAATTTTVTSSLNPAKAGQSVTFTATVTSTTAGTPTGTITFLDGSASLGTATLNGSAQASLSTSSLSVGMHSITAAYSGDATFASSTSTVLTETVTSVGPATTTTTLTSMPNPSNVGQSVTFTATVTSTTAGTPSGTVTFLDGATSLGTGMLNASAQATFSTSALLAGMHSITASYGGDANFAASVSTALTQAVNGTPDFSVTANPSAASVNAGQSTTYTLTLTPNNGFNQTVTLTCSGSPAASTCTPASSTVTLNGTSASMVQFNVTTRPRASALFTEPTQPLGPLSTWPTGTLLLLAMMAAAMLYGRQGRQGRPRRLALGLTIAVVALMVAACGSNHHASAGTPAGTYTLTLTGTSGTLTHSSPVTLTVK